MSIILESKDIPPDLLEYFEPIINTKSDVWKIPTQSFSGAHFATFPEKLIEPMIKAGTSEKGCCSRCGKAWERMVENTPEYQRRVELSRLKYSKTSAEKLETGSATGGHGDELGHFSKETKTIGWQPVCKCNAEIVPPVVCDIFMGSGTVALVAKKLGVNYVGIELNPKYIAMAEKRINGVEENLFKQTT